MDTVDTRRLYNFFAELLDYPRGSSLTNAEECLDLLQNFSPEAAQNVRDFLAFSEREGQERMEEIYTRTFDVTPTTNLYVGYHLFGESFKRGAFLARLQEAYCYSGFNPGAELPDHLPVVLRFAAIADDPEFVGPLLEEGVLPALEKAEEALKETVGYGPLITALRSLVRQNCQSLVAAGGL